MKFTKEEFEALRRLDEDIDMGVRGKTRYDEMVEAGTVPPVRKWEGYEKLYDVFMDAMYRASCGKGKERHVSGDEPFEEQFILRGARTFGIAALRFQIAKKNEEVGNLVDYQAKINEFLDIMVYAAAAVIRLKEIIEERKMGIPI